LKIQMRLVHWAKKGVAMWLGCGDHPQPARAQGDVAHPLTRSGWELLLRGALSSSLLWRQIRTIIFCTAQVTSNHLLAVANFCIAGLSVEVSHLPQFVYALLAPRYVPAIDYCWPLKPSYFTTAEQHLTALNNLLPPY